MFKFFYFKLSFFLVIKFNIIENIIQKFENSNIKTRTNGGKIVAGKLFLGHELELTNTCCIV